jgi:hypothetical protein
MDEYHVIWTLSPLDLLRKAHCEPHFRICYREREA